MVFFIVASNKKVSCHYITSVTFLTQTPLRFVRVAQNLLLCNKFCLVVDKLIAYEDLGAEALRKLYVEDMPLVVIIDSEGNNLYEE